jgi:hypothetical protein
MAQTDEKIDNMQDSFCAFWGSKYYCNVEEVYKSPASDEISAEIIHAGCETL